MSEHEQQRRNLARAARRGKRYACLATGAGVVLLALTSRALCAQGAAGPATRINDVSDERARADQLLGRAPGAGYMFRSFSSMNADSGSRPPRVRLFAPELRVVDNTRIPFSINDGALWAGRGANSVLSVGGRFSLGALRVVAMPELLGMPNEFYSLPDARLYDPKLPADYSPFASPWHTDIRSIDAPLRFGDRPIHRLDPGQSSVYGSWDRVEAGASTENEWWGPGVRNALVLSNNAGGFPHAFVRTRRPVHTAVGDFEGRYVIGQLTESDYFVRDGVKRHQGIAVAGLTYAPRWEPMLTLGVVRSVYWAGTAGGSLAQELFAPFANVGRPNNRPTLDPFKTAGRDQIMSLFARWVFPDDGFEAYTEWGRNEFPASLRDLLVYPQHAQGYTLGVQKATVAGRGTVRVAAELTSVERGGTFVDRPWGSWYTSRTVIEGYTQRGQVLGASVGSGGSGQWIGADYLAPAWQVGLFGGRIRWDEEGHHAVHPGSSGKPDKGSCEMDVSLFGGVRAGLLSRFGRAVASWKPENRLNFMHQNFNPCSQAPERIDVRNQTWDVVLTPALRFR